jgi:rhomboid-like protein
MGRMFDHVAHLGGAVFGLVYYQYGRQAWVWLRKQLGAQQGGAGIY